MRLSSLVCAIVLGAAVAPLASVVHALPANHNVVSGYEVPAYGKDVKIVTVFRKPTGSLVLKFIYTSDSKVLTDFYDTDQKTRLAPSQEEKMANNNTLQQNFIRAKSLQQLSQTMRLVLPNGTVVENLKFDGRICTWPYPLTFDITPKGQTKIRRMLFVKQDKPVTQAFERDCEGVVGTFKLTARYREEWLGLYPDGASGFYAHPLDLPYIIHFDATGQSSFFKGRSDMVLLPAEKAMDAYDKASEDNKSSQHSFIDGIEAEIDNAIKTQKRSPR